jgi:multisubunit Na+/H+ antiporter MnhE subunit
LPKGQRDQNERASRTRLTPLPPFAAGFWVGLNTKAALWPAWSLRLWPMRRVTTWLAWWALLFAFWLVLTFTPVFSELVVGAAAASIAATAAELVWHQRLIGFRPRPTWVLRAYRLPREVVRDTFTVFGVLFRHLTGRQEMRGAWRAIPIDAGGDEPRSATRRALIATAISATPNAYVVGIDSDNGLMLVHQLKPSPETTAEADLTYWLKADRGPRR